MSLANQVLDFVDDIDRSLLKQIGESASQDFLKTASVLTPEEREKLATDDFALVIRTTEGQVLKKFPTSDASNTWLSSQYFEKTSEQLPYIAQKIAATNLKRACVVFNLTPPASIEKLASNEIHTNSYNQALDWTKKTAPLIKISEVKADGSSHFFALGDRYPMPNADFVKKASSYFAEHVKEFEDSEDRHVFAENVLARAKELSVTLEEEAALKKYASDQYGTELTGQIALRLQLLEFKPQLHTALSKLAEAKKDTDATTFAKALNLFDKKAGLQKYYGRYLSDPFKSTFSVTEKVAGYHWEDETSGLSITEKELCRAFENKSEKITSFFGSTLADALKKHGSQIFDSLPTDAKETIVKIAKGEI